MDAILYLLMFACGGLVIGWYVVREAKGDGSDKGLLAIREDAAAPDDAPPAPRYRTKARRGAKTDAKAYRPARRRRP